MADTQVIEGIEALKADRTRRKCAVTLAIKKLENAVEGSLDLLDSLVYDLDSVMKAFERSHYDYCIYIESNEGLDDYKTVNRLNLDDYFDEVSKSYLAALAKVTKVKRSQQDAMLSHQVQSCIQRLSKTCEQSDILLNNTDVTNEEVLCFLNDVEELSDKLSKLSEDLSQVHDDNTVFDNISAELCKSDDIKRQCKAHLRSNKGKTSVSHVLPSSDLLHNLSDPTGNSQGLDFSVSQSKHISLNSTSNDSVGHVRIRKTELPIFSGSRTEWPEFKSLWKELAEGSLHSPAALAYELKRCLKGQASEKVKSIYITRPEAYGLMWERLSEYYDDTSSCVQAALDGLSKLKPVSNDDYKGIVHLVDVVESVYAQLKELGHIDILTMREVDKITDLLPSSVRMVWVRSYHQLDADTKLRPMEAFMKFLQTERSAVARLAERAAGSHRSHHSSSNTVAVKESHKLVSGSRPSCVVHTSDGSKHKTSDCRNFIKLSLDDKYKALKAAHACFKCFQYHRRSDCTDKSRCLHCKGGHHHLLCRSKASLMSEAGSNEDTSQDIQSPKLDVNLVSDSNVSQGSPICAAKSDVNLVGDSNVTHHSSTLSLYAIQQALIMNSGKMATVFCDSGSNTTYITHAAADRLKAKKLDRCKMDITTVGNQSREYDTRLYELSIRTVTGKVMLIHAFGMKEITQNVSKLDLNCLSQLFPDYDVSVLQRKASKVDILLGCNYFGLHPKHEVCRAGSHLSIMSGELGVCLQGSHPRLQEKTQLCLNMTMSMHASQIRSECNHLLASHPEFVMPSEVHQVTQVPQVTQKFPVNCDISDDSGTALMTEYVQAMDTTWKKHSDHITDMLGHIDRQPARTEPEICLSNVPRAIAAAPFRHDGQIDRRFTRNKPDCSSSHVTHALSVALTRHDGHVDLKSARTKPNYSSSGIPLAIPVVFTRQMIQRDTSLPGEKLVKQASTDAANANTVVKEALLDYKRFSKFSIAVWVVAMLLGVARAKSFLGARIISCAPLFQDAKLFILLQSQEHMQEELGRKNGKYSRLNPVMNENGLWVIGQRLRLANPMTPESNAQVLLSNIHPITHLLMREAHVNGGHRGRDATLARFRQQYWVPQGSKLAWKVKVNCQLCKLQNHKLLEQEMGLLPIERLKSSPPFNAVMIDLFGPFQVRGEVQKRITGKAYGVMFVDLVTRAVHLEGVYGYDTASFLLAFSRFVSIRGWPSVVYSDPGSQLIGAEKELRVRWKSIDRSQLVKKGAENGLKWMFGPADSPWHQGLVEALIKSAKRAIHLAINNHRLSPSEFLTLCAEIANLLNERPIGALSGQDSELSILTPNSLLLGRATAKNPGQWQPLISSPEARFHWVQKIAEDFWNRWIESCAPALVVQSKWKTSQRNLKVGDVVIISDRNMLRGEYRLALVREAYPGSDGKVRKVLLSYKNFKVNDTTYHGAPDTFVTRSVQRLSLLVPVDTLSD